MSGGLGTSGGFGTAGAGEITGGGTTVTVGLTVSVPGGTMTVVAVVGEVVDVVVETVVVSLLSSPLPHATASGPVAMTATAIRAGCRAFRCVMTVPDSVVSQLRIPGLRVDMPTQKLVKRTAYRACGRHIPAVDMGRTPSVRLLAAQGALQIWLHGLELSAPIAPAVGAAAREIEYRVGSASGEVSVLKGYVAGPCDVLEELGRKVGASQFRRGTVAAVDP
jgi:hypothetical protein